MSVLMDKGQVPLMADLIPTIIQDQKTGQVLMLAYSNQEAMEKTKETGKVHFFSRSRQKLWLKGETSGNFLNLVSTSLDCDQDALLYQVRPSGPTCHRLTTSCFDGDDQPEVMGTSQSKNKFQSESESESESARTSQSFDYLIKLQESLKLRLETQAADRPSYTQKLFNGTKGYLSRKLIEETGEVVEAFTEGNANLADEIADLLYHLSVLMIKANLSFESVYDVLESRKK